MGFFDDLKQKFGIVSSSVDPELQKRLAERGITNKIEELKPTDGDFFSDLKQKFGIVSPSVDPALKAQLEKRGLPSIQMVQSTSGLFDDLKKKFGITSSPALVAKVGEGLSTTAPAPGMSPYTEAGSAKKIATKIPEVPIDTTSMPLEVGKAILQAPQRAITSVALPAAQGIIGLATGKDVPQEFRPTTPIQRALLGDEPIVGIGKRQQDTQKEIESMVGKGDIRTGAAIALSALGVAGMIGMDLAAFGGEKKAAEKIAMSKNIDEIFNLIKPILKGKTDDEIKFAAQELVDVLEPKEVQEYLLKKLADVPPIKRNIKNPVSITAEGAPQRTNFADAYQELKKLPKGENIENPDGLMSVGKISEDSKKIIDSNVDDISLTRKSLKHIAEKPNAFPEDVVMKIPEIVSNPTEIRLSKALEGGEKRYLFIKQNGDPLASVVEVAIDKNKNTVVTVFKTDKGYLSDFDLLWKTGPDEGVLPSAYPAKRDAGSRPEFSALKEVSNTNIPQIGENVKSKGFDANDYVGEMTKNRDTAAGSAGNKVFGKISNFYAETKKKLVDFSAPIEDVLRMSEKGGKYQILPKYDITNQIDRVLRSPTIAGQFVRDNGLEGVIREVDNLDALDQYLIAKQVQKVESMGIKTGRNLEKDKQLIEALQEQYEPYAQQVTQYSQKLLDYSVDSGLISKELADKLKQTYPDYVPLNRVFNELERTGNNFGGGKSIASLSNQSVVQTLKGSEREIESPVASLLNKTADAFRQGEKNKAAGILAGYKDLPGNPFQLRELPKEESAPFTISFLYNGVKRTFETTKDIAYAAKALSVQQLNILGKIFALPVRVAKVGITGINLPFVASNIVKDQLTAVINSSNALKTSVFGNPLNFVRSLFEAVGHGKLYEEMAREGAMGTSFDIARNQVIPTIKKLRATRTIPGKILYTITHPSELLRTVENIVGRSEELTRIQQYAGTKEAMLLKGMTEDEAKIMAAKASRENTVNFARRGEWGQVLNSAFLYLNAGIQGTRTFLRNMATKPVATSAKLALTVFTPIAATTFWNLSDPERKKAYEDIAEFEKENNIIIIPPNPTKDENGKWNIIKIPLSQEVNNIASVARRPIEQVFGLDPVRAGEVAKAFIGTVSPISPDKGSIISTLTPQAIKPALEAVTNQNFFTGYKQVPDSMKNLSPELQVKDNTSGTARELGKLLKLSPIKIEAFIKGTVGGVGEQLIHLSDVALAGLDIIPKDQVHGQKIIEAITARFIKAVGGNTDEKSNKQLEQILTKQADDRFKTAQEAELLYQELKNLPPDEANTKAKELKTKNLLLYNALEKVVSDNKKGLDYNDRLINQLGVTNGERAKFIWETLKAFKTNEEKNNYVNELKTKKIISDEVMKQLRQLKELGY